MHHAVTTAWAVVHIVVVHQRRLLADDVLWLSNALPQLRLGIVGASSTLLSLLIRLNYLISIHNLHYLLKCVNNFLGIGNDTSQATELLYGHCTVGSQTNILYHLTSIDLGYQDTLHLL